MTTLPANIIYGVVTGRLVLAGPDGPDEDDLPEPIPVTGRITFTPSVKAITDSTSNPGNGTTIPLQTQTVLLEDGQFSVKLVATNYGNPQGWTWLVSFELISTPGLDLQPFAILVPGNTIVDLAHAQPIDPSSGVSVIQAVGMPRGGTTGQYIVKLSDTDYHFGFVTGGGGTGTSGPVLVESIEDASALGKQLLTAIDAAAARGLTGAGTSDLALGTTGTTAKAGDWKPAAADITDSTTTGRSILTALDSAAVRTTIGPTTVDELDATSYGKNLLKATSLADARAAIGAGTSSLTVGTTSSTAKAGNWVPAWNDVTSKPTFHNVATSGDYNSLANLPTEPPAHTHADLESRITTLEALPRIIYIENEGDPIPATARPQDYVVYRNASTEPPPPEVTTLKSFYLAGVNDGTNLTTAGGTGDTALDQISTTIPVVRVNGQGVREIEVPATTQAITWRWTSLTLTDVSCDFGLRVATYPSASSTVLVAGGWFQLSMSSSGTLSVLNSAGTFVGPTASPALSTTGGIYRIKAFRTAAGPNTTFRIYDSTGALIWDVTRDVGVATNTSFIMGRTGTTAQGNHFFSSIRLHNVGTELT